MKRLIKTAALAVTVLGAPLAMTSVASAQTLPPPVVIIVDMDEVINTSAAGKQAATELKTRADAIQARLASLRTQFGTEGQTLAKSRPAPTATPAIISAWEAKARDLQTRQQAAETDLGARDRDFQAARQSVLKQINDASQPVISTVMRERGATIVLAEGATLQHSAAIDVTSDIIARLDKSLPRVSTTATAPAAK